MGKGISTVIATLLMLIITIALAGFAYTYLSGVITQQTAVVLEILDASCSSGTGANDAISMIIRNSGTSASSDLSVSAIDPTGDRITGACDPLRGLAGGSTATCTVDRGVANEVGSYQASVSATGARPVRGTAYCTTVGQA